MADKKITSVYQTDNYEKFKIVEGNRPINHAKKIMESIKAIGMLWQPILVNERFEIIDGQGRFLALKTLNLPIIYIMQNGLSIKEVRYLNKNASIWKINDYIHSYACGSDYKESYKNIEEIRKQFPEFDQKTIIRAAGEFGLSAVSSETINSGDLDSIGFRDMNIAINRLVKLREFLTVIPPKCKYKSKLLYGIIFCIYVSEVDANFKIDQLREAISKNFGMVEPANTIIGAIQNLDYIYNYKRNFKNKYSITRKYEDVLNTIKARNIVSNRTHK